MADTVRLGLNAVWVVLAVLYLTPLMQGVGLSFGNVPFFAIWATIVGPLLMVALYAINSYRRIEEDKTVERGEATAAAGGE